MAEKEVSRLPCNAWLALSVDVRRDALLDSAAWAVGRDWVMREVSAWRAAVGVGGGEGGCWSAMVEMMMLCYMVVVGCW